MFKKIHHVAVVVKSADEALGFYRDALGLPVTKDAVIEDQGVRGVLLACGHSEIELIEPVRAGTGVARFLETRGEGLHHVCLESDDVAADLKAAQDKGLSVIDKEPRRGLAGMIGFLHPRATRGVLVEYATPLPDDAPDENHGAGHAEPGVVNDLDHVVAAVHDLDAGAKVWQDNFALPLDRTAEVPTLGIKQAILPISSAFIEVITPLGEDGPVATFLKERGEGLYLLSLAVGDLDAAIARLRERGSRVGDPTGGSGGARLAFVSPRSAHGVTIQLIERAG